MSDFSSTWRMQPIKHLYKALYDGPHATPSPSINGPVFLGIKNITDDGALDLSDVRHIAEEDFARWTQRVEPRPGDLVFTYEATLNRYAIIPEGFRGCLGRRLALIRLDPEKTNVKFLHRYFFSERWREVIKNNMLSGSTVDRIPLTRFPDFPVCVPPINEQKRIAGILSAYDELIENNQRRIKILEEMARSLYREWFVRFRYPGHESVPLVPSPLGPIPQGWTVCPFTDVVEVLSGGTPKTEVAGYWNGQWPFFTPRDAPQGFYALTAAKHVTDAGLAKCASKLYPKNTVFITARGTVGKVVLASVPMAMNQSCYALRTRSTITQFLLYLLTLQQVEHLRKNTGGSTFDTIVIDTFQRMNVIVPVPALSINFTNRVEGIFLQMEVLERQTNTLRRTRDLLLPRLLSGQLPLALPQEPLDHVRPIL